jgi:hypothetical protein
MFDTELAAIPAHPPRTGVLPGMRLGAAIPKATLILLFAIVLLFAAFPLLMIGTDPKARLQIGPSRTAEGRVLSATDVSGCRGLRARRIVYLFSPESRSEFRGVGIVCQESPYYSVQVADKVEIRYLRRDPTLSSIAGSDSDNEPPIFLFVIFPLFIFLLVSPVYFPLLREVMYARQLYRVGVLVQGTVVFVKKRTAGTLPGWPGSSTADVYVAHPRPTGGRAETVVGCTNDWLANQLSPGTTVHILLPTDQSKRGALLETFLR